MCRLYQPLCISLLQKNNSIFDRLFTNTLLHKSPLPLSFETYFCFWVTSFAFFFMNLSNKTPQPSAWTEDSNNISVILRRWETKPLSVKSQNHNLTTAWHWKAVATEMHLQVIFRPCNWTKKSGVTLKYCT